MSGQFDIGVLDIAVLVAFLILTRVVALLIAGRSRSSEEYFLAGRNLSWPLIGLSLFATNISAATFVGLAAGGYSQGVSVSAYAWMAAIILVFFLIFMLPLYLRSRVYTLPEFLGRRYDGRSRLAFSGFNMLLTVAVSMSAALYAGGLIIQTLFPAILLWVSIVAMTLLAAAYTITGGFRAVVITDAIQSTVIIVGAVAVFIVALQAIPSWDAVRQATPEGQLSIIQPASDEALPWPGLISGVVISGLYAWTTNQLFVQRLLGARSLDDGRWGSIFAGFLKVSQLFIFVLPGVFAVALFPNLDNPDLAFPSLAFGLLPIGVRGLLLAAMVAAIISTVDSALNSASSLVTMDFARVIRPNASDQDLLRIGRITTVVFTIFAMVWAPQIVNFTTLYGYLQSSLAYLTPPIVATFLMGVLWSRTNRHAAFWTLVTLVPIGVVGFIMNEVLGVFTVQFLYVSAASFIVSLLLLAIISLLTGAPAREQVESLVWRPELWRQDSEELKGKPLLRNYRFWSVTLLISTLVIVYIFR